MLMVYFLIGKLLLANTTTIACIRFGILNIKSMNFAQMHFKRLFNFENPFAQNAFVFVYIIMINGQMLPHFHLIFKRQLTCSTFVLSPFPFLSVDNNVAEFIDLLRFHIDRRPVRS